MAADEKWYFTKEQLQNTPSRTCGFDADKELSYRQQAANFIQDMGQKLQVSQLCINTAIVYMHRFYMFHSFTHFPWNTIAAASFFLAAKVEEQPRKLEHVIRIANHCLHRDQPTAFDAKSEQYAAQSQELVFNENVLLQTLGFDVAIDHPHTHVVRCCHLVRASKDLAQTSYFMASNSLHLTTMCLQYKPTVVACFCIHLACKWSNWQIPKSNEGKDWFYYVDKSVSSDLLEQLTAEFLKIFDKCPSRLKRKITTINQNHSNSTIEQLHAASTSSSPFDLDARKFHNSDKETGSGPTFHSRSHHEAKPGLSEDPHKKTARPHDPMAAAAARDREYREKKERERLEREKTAAKAAAAAGMSVPSGKHMPHHRPPPPVVGHDPAKMKMHHPTAGRTDLTNGRDSRDREREHQKYLAQQQQQHPAHTHNSSSGDVKLDPNRQKSVGPDGKLPLKQHDPNRHRERERDRHRDLTKPSSAVSVPASMSAVNSVSASDVLNKPLKSVASTSAPTSLSSLAPVSNNSAQDKNSYLSKQINSTSQRLKSPFSDVPKSVPVPPVVVAAKANGSAPPQTLPPAADLPQLTDEPLPSSPLPPPAPKKTSSLFSPEKTPPQNKKSWPGTKTPIPSTGKRSTETPSISMPNSGGVVPPPLSPFGSPPPTAASLRRSRTVSSSSNSEPELRPVVKKLDQTPGFENIIRDSKMGIKLPKVPDIIQPICDRAANTTETSISKELKPPDIIKPFNTSLTEAHHVNAAIATPAVQSQPIVNGIETDPAAISTLLKEAAPTINHLSDDVRPVTVTVDPTLSCTSSPNLAPIAPYLPPVDPVIVTVDKHKSEHHYKSEKKKKKDKHKHKDKDRARDEKKKKHKDKDKERHKSKSEKTEASADVEVPLKITISKDKVQPVLEAQAPTVGSGLKVKISKDRLKSDVIEPPPPAPAPSALKIKISKDQIQYNSVVDSASNASSGRKRERERDREKMMSGQAAVPPTKISKTSYSSSSNSSRQNGRSSYNKVTQLGDGEAAQVRLAESKYHSKGASKTS